MLKENFVATIEKALQTHWDVPCFSNLNGPSMSYGQVASSINRLHHLFEKSGIKRGDRIGVVGRNSAHWGVTYLATVSYGAIIVPILPDFTSSEIEHIVRHSECNLLFVSEVIYDGLTEEKMPSVKGIFKINDFSLFWQNDKAVTEASEAALLLPDLTPEIFSLPEVSNDDMAAIVYTSGTTGFSKGVMLTSNSLIANVIFFNRQVDLEPGENIVSFLPLAHAFGCSFDFLSPLVQGCHITFIEKIPTPKVLLKCFAELKPAVVMSVPLIIEKIYKNRIKPLIETPKMQFMLKVPGLNKVVHKKIREKIYDVFGGNYKQLVIGGAALNKDIEDFFRTIGLSLTCGYGMTECGPLISYSPWENSPPVGSVGKIIDYLECRIADPDAETGIGEVHVRGENLMLGYYLDEESTKQTMDSAGWLLTGDLGRLDNDGNLFLTGRSKNMILTATGQNVYPEEIESQLNNMPCVEESLIVENEGKLVALVYPNLESVDKACLQGRQVEEMMEDNRKSLNLKLPGFCQISKLKVRYEEFEKTPTKKIKRRFYQVIA
ncbi:MAG: long-chain fatty acid--CoA ligase [bacterium]|nr:long-chain fatty acid--CoA ligase [bacterium]